MAKAHYDGVNGIARKVTKRYDGVAGVARKVTKAYDGVAGVARQYFASVKEVTWKKYNCTRTENLVYVQDSSENGQIKEENYYWTSTYYHTGYRFSKTSGFSGTGKTETSNPDDFVGNYLVSAGVVRKILTAPTITFIKTNVYQLEFSYEVVDKAVQTVNGYTYTKGSTSYGTVTAPEGALPESGTLMEGSADGDYCVLKVGSTYYYYVKN